MIGNYLNPTTQFTALSRTSLKHHSIYTKSQMLLESAIELIRICKLKNQVKAFLFFLAIPMLLSCKRDEDRSAAFTLETGLESEVGACIEEQPSSVLIEEAGTSQMVRVVWEFPCGAEVERPYLTATRNGGATLVFTSDYGKSSCSCTRSIKIKINNRLENGDTLYVVANKEVVGHKSLAIPR